jgi:hypothetical protein
MKYLVPLFAAACLARATRATSAPLPSFQSQSHVAEHGQRHLPISFRCQAAAPFAARCSDLACVLGTVAVQPAGLALNAVPFKTWRQFDVPYMHRAGSRHPFRHAQTARTRTNRNKAHIPYTTYKQPGRLAGSSCTPSALAGRYTSPAKLQFSGPGWRLLQPPRPSLASTCS